MMTLKIFELPNGRFTVRPVDGLAPEIDPEEFETRVEAEGWLFQRSEQLAESRDPDVIIPGAGQDVS